MVLGFGKKGPSGVGCYGKLPLHGDYVSHQNDGAEARVLSAWLDDGYRLAGGRDDIEAAELKFYHPGKRAIFGGIWPSRDASGTRRFPFSLFATTNGRELADLGALAPLGLAPGWKHMAEALPAIREESTPDGVQGLVSAIPVPELAEPEAVRAEFVAAAKGPVEIGSALEIHVDLTRLAAALSGGKKGEFPSFAARIPLVTEAPALLESAAWLTLLARHTGSEELPGQCHLFIRPSGPRGNGDLFVFHRELRPEDLGFMLAPDEEYPYANQLGLEPDEDAYEDLADKLLEKAGEAGACLMDLVELEEPATTRTRGAAWAARRSTASASRAPRAGSSS